MLASSLTAEGNELCRAQQTANRSRGFMLNRQVRDGVMALSLALTHTVWKWWRIITAVAHPCRASYYAINQQWGKQLPELLKTTTRDCIQIGFFSLPKGQRSKKKKSSVYSPSWDQPVRLLSTNKNMQGRLCHMHWNKNVINPIPQKIDRTKQSKSAEIKPTWSDYL